MYNPDVDCGLTGDSPEIKASPDRKEKIDKLVKDIHEKARYGITRIGDRLTIRNEDVRGNYYEIQLVVLEVKLKRDFDQEEENSLPDYK